MAVQHSSICILAPQWVIPVVPRSVVLEDHAVVIDGERIAEIGPLAAVRDQFPSVAITTLPGHALIPGLVNAHTHAAMSLLRGFADDLPLDRWLAEYIWPTESKRVDPQFVRDGTQLAIAEMIRGGTTCFNDMYFFADETAAVVDAAGMRACLGMIVIDFPSAWARDADEYLAKAAALHDSCRDFRRITTAFAPHAPYTVSNEPLRRVAVLAEELDVPVHIHVHETAKEVQESLEQHGMRPLARLQQLGLVSPRLNAVHLTQIDAQDIDILARGGAHCLHCAESNLKLASGLCPTAQLQKAGINVAIGTDGPASNNDLDMIGELRTAALLAKAVAGDAAAFDAPSALEAATLGGARALALDASVGSIEVGKLADLTAIHLDELATLPVFEPISQIVYAASRSQVRHVWIGGQQVLVDGELTTMDEHAISNRARQWTTRMGTPYRP